MNIPLCLIVGLYEMKGRKLHMTQLSYVFCNTDTTPHAPYNLSVETTRSTALLMWLPSYDGGYPQHYVLWSVPLLSSDPGHFTQFRSCSLAAWLLSIDYYAVAELGNQTVNAINESVNQVVNQRTNAVGRVCVLLYVQGLTALIVRYIASRWRHAAYTFLCIAQIVLWALSDIPGDIQVTGQGLSS